MLVYVPTSSTLGIDQTYILTVSIVYVRSFSRCLDRARDSILYSFSGVAGLQITPGMSYPFYFRVSCAQFVIFTLIVVRPILDVHSTSFKLFSFLAVYSIFGGSQCAFRVIWSFGLFTDSLSPVQGGDGIQRSCSTLFG